MTCPFCAHREDKVIDSRESKEGDVIRRRRECLKCERRFTTYERSDDVPFMVVKRDGRREKFERQKVLEGLLKACQKRPVGVAKLAEVVDAVDENVTDGMFEVFGLFMHFVPGEAESADQEGLQQPMATDHAQGEFMAGG